MSLFKKLIDFFMKMNLRLTLVKKLILVLALLFITFFMIIGFFTEDLLQKQILVNTQESASLLLRNEVESIENTFWEYEKIGINSAMRIKQWILEYKRNNRKNVLDKLIVENGAYRTDLKKYNHDDISGVFLSNIGTMDKEVLQIISATESKFDAYAKGVTSFVFNMYLITKHQMIRIYEKDWALEIEADHNFRNDIFYNIGEPQNNPRKKPVWTKPYYDSIWKRWMTSLITPIYIDNEFIGIVGHDVILDDLYKKVLNKVFYNSGYSFIFDSNQNIIVHPEYLDKLVETAQMGTLLNTKDVADSLLKNYISTVTDTTAPINILGNVQLVGDNDLYISSKLNVLNWYLTIKIPADEVLTSLDEFRTNFYYASIVASVLLFTIIVVIIWFSVVAPIKKLTITANQIQEGDLDKKVEIESNDEIGILGHSFNDMTSQLKKQLNEVKAAEEKYKSIFDSAVEGILKTNTSGKILECNSAAATILGYEDAEEFKKSVNDIGKQIYVNPPDRENLIKELIKNEIVENFITQFYKKDGSKIWIAANLSCQKNSAGKIITIEGLLTDITEQKRANEALRYTNTLLQTEFDNSTDGILVVDSDGKMISFNKQFVKMWEIPDSVIESKSDQDAIVSVLNKIVDVKSFISKVESLYKNKDEKSIDEILLKDGQIFLRYSSPLKSSDNFYYGRIWYFRDISEQRKIQKELLEAKDRAELSDKLKSEFLAQVSHEIRTPINSILSFSSLIQSELEKYVSEELKVGFDSMSRAGQRIIRTIDLILNMSEIQSGTYDFQPAVINVYEKIVKKCYDEFKYLAKQKNIELFLTNNTEELNLYIDEYTVTQIVQNLIDNAIKYTKKGSVKIILSRDEENNFEFRVTDTGIGISKEYIPNLFHAFTQEEQGYTRLFEGNGLGLALVKKYCTLNSAEILVESEKGVGTEFKVVFKNNR